jgi:hypothetical protein
VVILRGTGIADSSFDSNNKNNKNIESFKNLQSYQNAKNGETGLLTEKVNGKNISIAYTPCQLSNILTITLMSDIIVIEFYHNPR